MLCPVNIFRNFLKKFFQLIFLIFCYLQCLSPTPQYTEQIHETLKIFDRLFAEFEFSYVSCMVHVKTIKGKTLFFSLDGWKGVGGLEM